MAKPKKPTDKIVKPNNPAAIKEAEKIKSDSTFLHLKLLSLFCSEYHTTISALFYFEL